VLNDPRQYWVGFSLVKGIGAVRFQTLLDFFGRADIAWQAPAEALREAGLSANLVENFLRLRASVNLEKIWDGILAQAIAVLTWEDPGYPRRLKEIAQPPPVLYLRGEVCPEDEWAVAIVGTRRVTAYGRQVTEEVATTLARSGVTIVSGLARGVDGIAHQAALNAGGRTLAILGAMSEGSAMKWLYSSAKVPASRGVRAWPWPPTMMGIVVTGLGRTSASSS